MKYHLHVETSIFSISRGNFWFLPVPHGLGPGLEVGGSSLSFIFRMKHFLHPRVPRGEGQLFLTLGILFQLWSREIHVPVPSPIFIEEAWLGDDWSREDLGMRSELL